MATEVRRRRGTTIEHSTFTGAVAELTVDLTKDTVVVHDGATQGGFPLLREDFSNVPTTAPFTNISLDTAIFDTAYSADGNEAQGTLYWNEDELTLSLVTNGQTTELGQKVEVHVKNQTGAQINKGEVVYASGTVGSSGRITVAKMIADGTIAAKRVVGVAAENIADGADGKVVHFGKIRKVNTDSYNEGDILWVSTTTAGAFQNTEPVQADGELALPIAFVVTKSINNGELFVRINAIDENEYQDYDAGLQDISGLTPSDSTIIVGDGTNWVAESGDTARASLGLSIGSDVQAWDAQLDTLSGLSADQATAIVAVTASEYTQLQNIDTVTISNTQWGYLGELDQSLTQASSPTFAGLTVDGLVVEDEVRTLQSDVIENHLEIESLQDNKVEVGFLFPDGDGQALGTGDAVTFSTVNTGQGDNELYAMNQNVRTTDAVTFATVDTGQGANELYAMNQDVQTTDAVTFATVNTGQGDNELYAMNQDVQTTDDVTFNVIDVTDKIESASGFTSGIIGAGTIYDMNDGNGSFFEVDNMRVRNELRAHVFKKDIVKASNAYLFITDSAEIAETSVIADTTDTFRVLADGSNASFAHGDLLWAKNIDDDGSLQVTGVKIEVSVQPQFVWDTSTETWNTSTITPDSYTEFASGTVTGGIHDGKTYTEYNIYEVTSGGTLNAGDTIVRVSGGSILNDASSTYSPFIDIYDGVQTWAQFQDVSKTKVRLGNLEGVSNTSGYGLYTQNAFLTGALVVGDLTKAGNYLEYTGSTMNVVTDTFSLTAGSMTIDSADGVVVDDNNFFKQDSTFSFGGGLLSGTPSTLAISGSGASIDVDTFTLDAGTAYLSSSGTPIMALDTSDASVANISTGTGFYADGAGNLRIGDSDTYLKFDTTNGLQIKIGSDDLSTAIADIRSDLIDIYLGNESTFSGIQFLSGQLVLKAGTGNSIASITLDGTQEDVSTISLDADYIVVTGTTIFKSAKDGSTTPTTLGDATFIDGGTIVTNSITATEIAANTITASEIDVDNLFAQEIEVTGKLLATDGTYETTVGKLTGVDVKIGTYTSNGDFYGLYRDLHNYFGIHDGDVFAEYAFRVGDGTNYLEFDGTDITINTDTFDLATTNLSIDSANEIITVGSGTTVTLGKITTDDFGLYLDANNFWKASFSDYFFKVGDATNFISFNTNSGILDIETDTFELDAGNLYINSSTTAQTPYTPDSQNSILDNYNFASTPNFSDGIDWDGADLSNSTLSYDATNDRVLFDIAKAASSTQVYIEQELDDFSDLIDKEVTFTVSVTNGDSGTSTYNWVKGELYFEINAEIDGSYQVLNRTVIDYSDVTGSGGTDTFDVTGKIRSDFTNVKVVVKFPEQDTTTGAPMSSHRIYINSVETVFYNQTQVTLNTNGLTIYNSPDSQIKLNNTGFSLEGIALKTDDISIPNLVEQNAISTSTMRVADNGYVSLAYTEVSGTGRLYVRLSDGTLKYVNLT